MKISSMLILALAILNATLVYSADNQWQKNYSTDFLNYPVNDAWLLWVVSIKELREETKSTIQDDVSKENEQRRAWFLGLHTQGDKIWYFTNPPDMWESLEGVRGYVLIRKGKQIATYITDTSNAELFLLED